MQKKEENVRQRKAFQQGPTSLMVKMRSLSTGDLGGSRADTMAELESVLEKMKCVNLKYRDRIEELIGQLQIEKDCTIAMEYEVNGLRGNMDRQKMEITAVKDNLAHL